MAASPEHQYTPIPRLGVTLPPPPRVVRRSGEQSLLGEGVPVIGYVAASSEWTADELRAREQAVARACERAGWELVAMVCDREDGCLLERRGLSYALEHIADGRARGVVVSDARLLSRALDFAAVVDWLVAADAALVALDLGVDTSTPEGSRVTKLLITLNRWRRGRRPRTRAHGGR
jgi:DNA invertase Pin-like site-specific DNA recombinase